MNYIRDLLRTARENIALVVALLVIAFVFALCWRYGSEAASGFGLNAFTETLGILITVLLVDHLLKRQAERRVLPQRAAAYEDTRLFLARMVSFWTDAFRDSTIRPPPSDPRDLFCSKAFDEILGHLNMDGEPNVIPRRKWFDWFPKQCEEFRKQGERILERHNSILAPAAYSLVHQLSTEGIDPSVIRVIRDLDRTSGFPRPTILGSYWAPPERFFDSVLALLEWAQEEERFLRQAGITTARAAPRTINPWDHSHTPKSRISDEELMRQSAVLQEFRAKNKTLNL